MDSHDHSDLFIHWLLDQWQFITMIATVIAAVALWYLHQVFTTKRATVACKHELLNSLADHERREEKRLDAFVEENKSDHHELRQDVKWIKHHLIEKGKLDS